MKYKWLELTCAEFYWNGMRLCLCAIKEWINPSNEVCFNFMDAVLRVELTGG